MKNRIKTIVCLCWFFTLAIFPQRIVSKQEAIDYIKSCINETCINSPQLWTNDMYLYKIVYEQNEIHYYFYMDENILDSFEKKVQHANAGISSDDAKEAFALFCKGIDLTYFFTNLKRDALFKKAMLLSNCKVKGLVFNCPKTKILFSYSFCQADIIKMQELLRRGSFSFCCNFFQKQFLFSKGFWLNKNVPLRLDENTIFLGVSVLKNKVVYNYEISDNILVKYGQEDLKWWKAFSINCIVDELKGLNANIGEECLFYEMANISFEVVICAKSHKQLNRIMEFSYQDILNFSKNSIR